MGRKLYVGNLAYEAGDAEPHDLFGRAGLAESVEIDSAGGRSHRRGELRW